MLRSIAPLCGVLTLPGCIYRWSEVPLAGVTHLEDGTIRRADRRLRSIDALERPAEVARGAEVPAHWLRIETPVLDQELTALNLGIWMTVAIAQVIGGIVWMSTWTISAG